MSKSSKQLRLNYQGNLTPKYMISQWLAKSDRLLEGYNLFKLADLKAKKNKFIILKSEIWQFFHRDYSEFSKLF